MLQSNLFTKIRKNPPSDEESKGAQLLVQGGYIQKEMAGVYAYLPLGKIVLDKIIQIIREEMNAVGGQEILLGSLQNPDLWKKTGRWSDKELDVWFKTHLQSRSEIGLATTHEEPLTNIMVQHINSHRDLPVYAYQFQTKFRNELRSKSGILRTREFIMKDLYSFNKTENEQENFYNKMIKAYLKIFERIGLEEITFLTFASGGVFSKFSHEFQAICTTGEDTVYLDREQGMAINEEVYKEEIINELGMDKDSLEKLNAIEIGNIFKLGTRFSKALDLYYTDENGERKLVVMGSYGIGPGRCLGAVAEILSDEKGLIWPEEISPFEAHLIALNIEENKVNLRAQEVYEYLKNNNINVLFDDRKDVSAGEKLQGADLLGIRNRIIVSKKTGNKVELKKRSEEKTKILELKNIIAEIS